ncbi:hypothetical protein HMPREF9630_00235 [Peptoanaerobacter stomatis]|uniref:Uncharacterized protein n=1 Tax=Peptoanaerobacter stomatis TaxID=796937 RepID=V9HRS6_9FIRM|nr:hypothetical protein [Peptoanaerobacter stomatis]EHL18510.1 hypothetical protein HMPREF9630_00235 [Peptoanaerobacter stomatis]
MKLNNCQELLIKMQEVIEKIEEISITEIEVLGARIDKFKKATRAEIHIHTSLSTALSTIEQIARIWGEHIQKENTEHYIEYSILIDEQIKIFILEKRSKDVYKELQELREENIRLKQEIEESKAKK